MRGMRADRSITVVGDSMEYHAPGWAAADRTAAAASGRDVGGGVGPAVRQRDDVVEGRADVGLTLGIAARPASRSSRRNACRWPLPERAEARGPQNSGPRRPL